MWYGEADVGLASIDGLSLVCSMLQAEPRDCWCIRKAERDCGHGSNNAGAGNSAGHRLTSSLLIREPVERKVDYKL